MAAILSLSERLPELIKQIIITARSKIKTVRYTEKFVETKVLPFTVRIPKHFGVPPYNS